jgi:hypothetical protein
MEEMQIMVREYIKSNFCALNAPEAIAHSTGIAAASATFMKVVND